MTVRLLCVGDVHLGRSPGGLERAGLAELGLGPRELGPRAAWERTVELALSEAVDALLLAGDVVDEPRDFFEGYPPLQEGVERLVAAGIRVLGVVGNHDVEVLPRLARHVQGFELIGPGGRWQRVRIEGRAGGSLDLVGWSFPQAQVRESPLPGLTADLLERRGAPLVGLMHADLDGGPSTYAPVRSAELVGADLDAWLLGHVHKPGALGAHRPIGYLGSLTALDANHIGPRGPWLLEASANDLRLTHLALAPLRFEPLAVDVSGVEDGAAAQDLILTAVRARASELAQAADADSGPRAVGLRLQLVGRTRVRNALAEAARQAEGTRETLGAVTVFVERTEILAGAQIDLEASARRADPLGLLAAQLLVLGRDPQDPERSQLLSQSRARLELRRREVRGDDTQESLDDEALVQRLRAAGDILLDALLEQDAAQGGAS